MATRDPNDFNNVVNFDTEVNSVERQYQLFNDSMFNMKPTAHNSVMMDFSKSTHTLLPSVDRGSRASTYGSDDNSDTRIFGTAYFKHSDYILPEDIENVRLVGTPDDVKTVEQATAEKIQKMRLLADQTDQYLMSRAIYKGQCITPSGDVIVDIFQEFGLTQETFSMGLDTATTDVLSKIRELKRKVRDGLENGGFYQGMMIDVDPIFFDKLITHDSVKEAYKYFANNRNQQGGLQPLRDTSDTFTHGGITFRAVDGSFSLPTGTTEKIIEDGTGHTIPMANDVFRGYYGSSNKLNRVNGKGGVNMFYMWQYPDPKDESYEMQMEMSRLYLPTKPKSLIKLTAA